MLMNFLDLSSLTIWLSFVVSNFLPNQALIIVFKVDSFCGRLLAIPANFFATLTALGAVLGAALFTVLATFFGTVFGAVFGTSLLTAGVDFATTTFFAAGLATLIAGFAVVDVDFGGEMRFA